jgi:hypothetical protein
VAYARAFFDLQLRFARTVAALSGQPLAAALLAYTNLYIRFGLGRDFDAAHPTWRAYLAGLAGAPDVAEWTREFHARCAGTAAGPDVVASSGCFGYARLDDERIRLHFQDTETDGHGPLDADRADRRRAELATLLAGVDPRLRVIGVSWLYNLEAYRRIFPPTYVATARVGRGRFQHMPRWGQFLDRRGEVREAPAREFQRRLDRQSSLEQLEDCFPLPVIAVEAPVQTFHEWAARGPAGPRSAAR